MSRKILGLDIRYDAVSAVLVRKGIRGAWVEAHEQVRVTDQNEIETAVSESLETITKNMDISGSACAVSIPADLVSFRNINVLVQLQCHGAYGKRKLSVENVQCIEILP